MRMNSDKSKLMRDDCDALMTVCKLLDVHTVGMQSRLDLGMPVEVDMDLIESDLEDIKDCVARLRRAANEFTGYPVTEEVLSDGT